MALFNIVSLYVLGRDSSERGGPYEGILMLSGRLDRIPRLESYFEELVFVCCWKDLCLSFGTRTIRGYNWLVNRKRLTRGS